jgi:hypothetical protein
MELDAVGGGPLSGPSFDVNGDGVVDSADNLGTAGSYASGVKQTSLPSAVVVQKNFTSAGQPVNKITSQSASRSGAGVGGAVHIDKNAALPTAKRSSWRQIF